MSLLPFRSFELLASSADNIFTDVTQEIHKVATYIGLPPSLAGNTNLSNPASQTEFQSTPTALWPYTGTWGGNYPASGGETLGSVVAFMTNDNVGSNDAYFGLVESDIPLTNPATIADHDIVDLIIIPMSGSSPAQSYSANHAGDPYSMVSGKYYNIIIGAEKASLVIHGDDTNDVGSSLKDSTVIVPMTTGGTDASNTFTDESNQTRGYVMAFQLAESVAPPPAKKRVRATSNYVTDGTEKIHLAKTDIVSGEIVVLAQTLWIARETFDADEYGTIATNGVYIVRKASAADIEDGQSMAWDISGDEFIEAGAAATGDITGPTAVAFENAGVGTVTLKVMLTGVAGSVTA